MRKELDLSPAGVSNGLLGGYSRSFRADAPADVGSGWIGATVLAGIFIWSYWPTLTGLWTIWERNPDYSGGRVVPLIAAYLAWADRRELGRLPVRTCWWGLAVLLAAQALRFWGVLYAYGALEHCSILLSITGMALLVLGRTLTWRLKWVLLFLALMFPAPGRVHQALALPLQDFATSSALFGLELLGVLVAREGNVLRLGDHTSIAVAEACSGLRMLTAFVVVAASLAFLVHRPAWQKGVLVLSSLPVAILSNTLRLIVTALLYLAIGSETAEAFFHDFAGVAMMPIAVGASLGLLTLMKWLSTEEEAAHAR